MTFHSGFYMKAPPEPVYVAIREQLEEIVRTVKKEKAQIRISPELTGKETQFGNLEELTRPLSRVKKA